MSVERAILASSKERIERFIRFMRSLKIKNLYEAELGETKDIFRNYNAFKKAVEGVDIVTDYDITPELLNHYFFSPKQIDQWEREPHYLQDLYVRGKNDNVRNMMRDLRQERIDSYTELNPYYRIYVGLPNATNEIVMIENLDQGGQIPVHEVDQEINPLTFNELYARRMIDDIISRFPDLEYLQFCENPEDPYRVRSLEDFEIIRYNETILDSIDMDYFHKAYDASRYFVSRYTQFNDINLKDYPAVSSMSLITLLGATFQKFQNYQLERYALGNYVDEELYNILDSRNLSELKGLSIGTLRNVIPHIDELLAKEGTREVFDDILDLVAHREIVIKRHYLVKKYNVSGEGDVNIDTKLTYDNNVDVEFQEERIRDTTTGAVRTGEGIIDYHEFVQDDPLWGNVWGVVDDRRRYEIRERLKKEILSLDISRIPTKYITISRVVDMIRQMHKMTDMLGLLLQINQDRGFMHEDSVIFRNEVEVTAMGLYAAIQWVYAKLNNSDDHDVIKDSTLTINRSMKLFDRFSIPSMIQQIKETRIALSSGHTESIENILGEEEIEKLEDHIIHFSYTPQTRIADIFREYDKNSDIVLSTREKIADSARIGNYISWEYILSKSIGRLHTPGLFLANDTFSEFLANTNPQFFNLIEPTLRVDVNINWEETQILFEDLNVAFREYVYNITDGMMTMDSSTDVSSNDRDVNDLQVLLERFSSIYTDLYKVEFFQSFSDLPYNSYQTRFEESRSHGEDNEINPVNVDIEHKSTKLTMGEKESFVMEDDWRDGNSSEGYFIENIEKEYRQKDDSLEGLEEEMIIPEDNILSSISAQHYNESVGLFGEQLNVVDKDDEEYTSEDDDYIQT